MRQIYFLDLYPWDKFTFYISIPETSLPTRSLSLRQVYLLDLYHEDGYTY